MAKAADQRDFFISYNHRDERWAVWIAWQLECEGFSTFLQAWDFRPGTNFVHAMNEGTTQCKRTIALLSPHYLTSSFTKAEWYDAFRRDPTGSKGLLLPIRVSDCDVEGLLGQIVCINLVDLDEKLARERLLASVVQSRAKPSKQPPFPPQSAPTPDEVTRPRFPGSLPPIWTIRYHSNPNFVGRHELLDRLHAGFQNPETTAPTQTIAGLGGAGKTELAIEYAYRFKDEYDSVFWVRAQDSKVRTADLAEIARLLDLPEKDKHEHLIVTAGIRKWLESNRGWLIIFDNA